MANNSTVFIVGFIIYIILMIFIGWLTSRGKSEGTDYLTGGRSLNILLIFGTIGATMIGTGSSMGAISAAAGAALPMAWAAVWL